MKYTLLLSILLIACEKQATQATVETPPPSISGTWRWTNLGVIQFDVVITQTNTTFAGNGVYYTRSSSPCTISGNFNYPSASWIFAYSASSMIGSGTMTHPDTIYFKWQQIPDEQFKLVRQ